jgi:hypothetical protein
MPGAPRQTVLAWPALLRALVEQEPSDPWPPIRSTTAVRICDASATSAHLTEALRAGSSSAG